MKTLNVLGQNRKVEVGRAEWPVLRLFNELSRPRLMRAALGVLSLFEKFVGIWSWRGAGNLCLAYTQGSHASNCVRTAPAPPHVFRQPPNDQK